MQTLNNILSILVALVILTVLSVGIGCLVAGLAHYRLGWDVERANAIGTDMITLVFTLGVLVGVFGLRRG